MLRSWEGRVSWLFEVFGVKKFSKLLCCGLLLLVVSASLAFFGSDSPLEVSTVRLLLQTNADIFSCFPENPLKFLVHKKGNLDDGKMSRAKAAFTGQ